MSSNTKTYFTRTTTPVGELLLVSRRDEQTGEEGLAGLYFASEPHAIRALTSDAVEDSNRAPFHEAIAQLDAYFSGKRTSFDVKLAPIGTTFQQDVWRALSRIPYGTTTTYARIAAEIGKPDAVRAVGAANGRNPLSIVVPCHRVIGKDGSLTGYAGGLANKKALLALESSRTNDQQRHDAK